MKHLKCCSLVLSIACLGVTLIGCSKKESTPGTDTAPTVTGSTNVAAMLAQAKTAVKAKEFDTAAQLLVTAQHDQAKSPEQAAAAREQMEQLQATIAEVLAKGSGDPKAKAAVEILRSSASGH